MKRHTLYIPIFLLTLWLLLVHEGHAFARFGNPDKEKKEAVTDTKKGSKAKKDEVKSTKDLQPQSRKRSRSTPDLTIGSDKKRTRKDLEEKEQEEKKENEVVSAIKELFEGRDEIDMATLRAFINGLKKKGLMRGADLSGYLAHENQRGKRSYESEQTRQILRHAATQLFHAASLRATDLGKKQPVEIQLMYAEGRIFIASNDNQNLDRIRAMLQENPEMLLKDYSGIEPLLTPEKKEENPEEALLQRIAAKMKKLSESGEFADQRQEAREILDLLLHHGNISESVGILNMGKPADMEDPFENETVKIWFVKEPDSWERHAEMKFIDMLKELKTRGEMTDRTYFIAGKKRPCAACSIELSDMKMNQGFDLLFGARQGKIWLKPLLNAINNAEDWDKLQEILKEKLPECFVSTVGPGYDSESSSDIEEIKTKAVQKARNKRAREFDEKEEKEEKDTHPAKRQRKE